MNTQKPLKNKVSITLDEDVIRQIRRLAKADDHNFSQYINISPEMARLLWPRETRELMDIRDALLLLVP